MNPFGFTKPSEILYGSILLYFCRLYERRNGTSKYALFAFFVTACSTILQFFMLSITSKYGVLRYATGPYALIFATVLQYYFDTPNVANIRIFKYRLPDKAVVLALALNLFLSSGLHSIIPGLCGLISGVFYRLNFANIKSLTFPFAFRNFGRKYLEPLFSSADPTISSVSTFFVRNSSTSGTTRSESEPLLQSEIALPPSEENIQALTAMGFSRDAAVRALQRTHNQLHRASNLLIDGQI